MIGITDTAMLRPQVFALQEGEVQVGLICSEKQAIDATLASLEKEIRASDLLPINTGMPAAVVIPMAAHLYSVLKILVMVRVRNILSAPINSVR